MSPCENCFEVLWVTRRNNDSAMIHNFTLEVSQNSKIGTVLTITAKISIWCNQKWSWSKYIATKKKKEEVSYLRGKKGLWLVKMFSCPTVFLWCCIAVCACPLLSWTCQPRFGLSLLSVHRLLCLGCHLIWHFVVKSPQIPNSYRSTGCMDELPQPTCMYT